MSFALPNLASRLFGVPLLAHPGKLEVIVRALEPRLLGANASESSDEGQTTPRSSEVTRESSVAVVPVLGSLVHRRLGMDAVSGMDSTQDLRRRVEAAVADESVDGILLEVDSPGGEVAGIFDLVDVIFEARQSKPVVAFVNESALSAGYALASAADKVVLPRTGMAGSVGVVAMHVDQSRLNEKVGIKPEFVFAGEKKVDGHPHGPMSDRARADLQAEVDKIHTTFVKTVARNRGLSTEDVRATQAGVFSGEDAISRGLADQIGGRAEALAALHDLIDARGGDTMTVVKIEKTQLAQLEAQAAKVGPLEAKLEQQAAALAAAEQTLEAFRVEQEAARERVHAEIVDGVADACMKAGATPPAADEREKILKALKADEDLGRFMAAQVRERILASARAVGSGAKAKSLDPSKTEDETKRKGFVAGVLKAAGKAETKE